MCKGILLNLFILLVAIRVERERVTISRFSIHYNRVVLILAISNWLNVSSVCPLHYLMEYKWPMADGS